MPVKQTIPFSFGTFFITFTCYKWLPLIEKVKGYNIIETAGKVLPVIIILILSLLAFFRRKHSTQGLITTMLFAMTVYFFLSTTVHPWYLITPLFLSLFTRYRYMLVWSFLVILSYYTYSNPEFNENLWLVGVEYIIVIGYFGWELFRKNESQGEVVRTEIS